MGWLTSYGPHHVRAIRRISRTRPLRLFEKIDDFAKLPSKIKLINDINFKRYREATKAELKVFGEKANHSNYKKVGSGPPYKFKNTWRHDKFQRTGAHLLVNHTVFGKLRQDTTNQTELWNPIAHFNISPSAHKLINEFYLQVPVSNGLQWMHHQLGWRYLKNFMWWRSFRNPNYIFDMKDFESSWAVMDQFLNKVEEAAHEYSISSMKFTADSVKNNFLDITDTLYFDQPRYYFMLRTLEFFKRCSPEVQDLLKPRIKEYFSRPNIKEGHLVLRRQITDPLDRTNLNQYLENPPSYIEKYVPAMDTIWENRIGDFKIKRNEELFADEEKLRKLFDKQMEIESRGSITVDVEYPSKIKYDYNRKRLNLEKFTPELVKDMLEKYMSEWERLLGDRMVQMYIEMSEHAISDLSLVESLKFLEIRAFFETLVEAGGDDPEKYIRYLAKQMVWGSYSEVSMSQEYLVTTMILLPHVWDYCIMTLEKALINPTFEDYKRWFDGDNVDHVGNAGALFHDLAYQKSSEIGLQLNRNLVTLMRETLQFHRTPAEALEWFNSNRPLEEDLANNQLHPWIMLTDTIQPSQNMFQDLAFIFRMGKYTDKYSAMPMLCPPRPYKIFDNQIKGQFLTSPRLLVKKKKMRNPKPFHIEESPGWRQYPKEKINHMLTACNAISQQSWSINKEIVKVLEEVTKEGGMYTLKIPMRDCWDMSHGIKSIVTTSTSDPLYNRHKQVETRLRVEEKGLYVTFQSHLGLVKYFSQFDEFWLPLDLDYRGRIYPTTAIMNPLSSDPYRASFLFGKAKKLGGRQKNGFTGFDWLLIQCISLSDKKKKATHGEMLHYAWQNFHAICDSGRDPLTGYRWWETCEKPFQVLAACMEIWKATQLDDPSQYETKISVHMDGTCNGFQHYSAMGRDTIGAIFTNVLPTERPSDFYQSILDSALKLMDEDIAAEGANFEKLRVAKIARKVVTRSIVKRPVMAIPYGLSVRGAVDICRNNLHGKISSADLTPVAQYIIRNLFSSINSTFRNSMAIKQWLAGYNRYCSSKLGVPIEYISPMGFPVSQIGYKSMLQRKTSMEVLVAAVDENRIKNERDNCYGVFPAADGQRSGNSLSPNFVHAIDASHLLMSYTMFAKAAKEERGDEADFGSIHDSFWCHPSQVDLLNENLREAFIDMYEHFDPITTFAEHMENWVIPERFWPKRFENLPENVTTLENKLSHLERRNALYYNRPEKGEMDIQKVRDSKYFFC